MNIAGLGLALLTILFVVCQFAAHKFIKKVTNTYWFWLAIGIFCFVWVVTFRFGPGWAQYVTQKANLDGSQYSDANLISKAWLLDICPFMSFFMPLAIIVDPTRKVAKAAAPLSIIGGIIICLVQMPMDDMAQWNAQFIFLGDSLNPCYFIMHFFNLVLGVGVMLNTPKYGPKGYLTCVGVAAIYYSYVAIVAHCLNCQWFVSGLNLNDWSESGEYYIVAKYILHCPIEVTPIIAFPVCFLGCSLFMILKDFVFNRWVWTYGDCFSGKWYAWYDYKHFKSAPLGGK